MVFPFFEASEEDDVYLDNVSSKIYLSKWHKIAFDNFCFIFVLLIFFFIFWKEKNGFCGKKIIYIFFLPLCSQIKKKGLLFRIGLRKESALSFYFVFSSLRLKLHALPQAFFYGSLSNLQLGNFYLFLMFFHQYLYFVAIPNYYTLFKRSSLYFSETQTHFCIHLRKND